VYTSILKRICGGGWKGVIFIFAEGKLHDFRDLGTLEGDFSLVLSNWAPFYDTPT